MNTNECPPRAIRSCLVHLVLLLTVAANKYVLVSRLIKARWRALIRRSTGVGNLPSCEHPGGCPLVLTNANPYHPPVMKTRCRGTCTTATALRAHPRAGLGPRPPASHGAPSPREVRHGILPCDLFCLLENAEALLERVKDAATSLPERLTALLAHAQPVRVA